MTFRQCTYLNFTILVLRDIIVFLIGFIVIFATDVDVILMNRKSKPIYSELKL